MKDFMKVVKLFTTIRDSMEEYVIEVFNKYDIDMDLNHNNCFDSWKIDDVSNLICFEGRNIHFGDDEVWTVEIPYAFFADYDKAMEEYKKKVKEKEEFDKQLQIDERKKSIELLAKQEVKLYKKLKKKYEKKTGEIKYQ